MWTYAIRKKGDGAMARLYKTDIIELKKAMIEAGLDKIIDLAEASGVDRNTISKILSGEIQPSSNVMERFVIALRLPPERAGLIFFNPNLRNT